MRFFAILLAVFTAIPALAQVDSVIDQKLYAGALWTGTVVPPSSDLTNNVSVRVSGQVITGNDRFRTTGRFIWTPKVGVGQIWSTYLRGKFEYRLGFMPRPMTMFMRSAPFTPGAHFEPSAKSVIPGAAWGLALFQSKGSSKINGGVYYNANRHWETNVAYTTDAIFGETVVAFFGGRDVNDSIDPDFGLALKEKIHFRSEVISDAEFSFFTGDTTLSVFSSVKVVPVGDFYGSWVNTVNVSGWSWSSDRSLEVGLTRDFEGGLAEGLFGLGYNWTDKAIKFYLFVHTS